MRAQLALLARLGELILLFKKHHVTVEANNILFNLLASISAYRIADESTTLQLNCWLYEMLLFKHQTTRWMSYCVLM